MIDIVPTENDDRDFVHMVIRTVRTAAGLVQPEDCYIIQLDNWFDHKWLLWPGQYPRDGGIPHERTPLPCFNPARVVEEFHYVRTGDPVEYVVAQETQPLHGYDGWYPRKIHRLLSDFSESAVFAWYSGSTMKTGHGSLMMYVTTDTTRSAWYASFRKNREWTLAKCQSISRREMESLAWGTSAKRGRKELRANG